MLPEDLGDSGDPRVAAGASVVGPVSVSACTRKESGPAVKRGPATLAVFILLQRVQGGGEPEELPAPGLFCTRT